MNEWKVNLRAADIVATILTLVICVVAFYVTTTWIPPILPGDPGAAFFPRIAIGIMFVFGVLLLFQTIVAARRKADDATPNEVSAQADAATVSIDIYQLIIALVSSAAVVAGTNYIGFEVATFAFLFILLGWRTGWWVWAFFTALISTGLMYFIFVAVLKVRLPLLFLPKYLMLF